MNSTSIAVTATNPAARFSRTAMSPPPVVRLGQAPQEWRYSGSERGSTASGGVQGVEDGGRGAAQAARGGLLRLAPHAGHRGLVARLLLRRSGLRLRGGRGLVVVRGTGEEIRDRLRDIPDG